MFDDSYTESLLGFLYLSYLEGKLDFHKFIAELIDVVDSGEYGRIDLDKIVSRHTAKKNNGLELVASDVKTLRTLANNSAAEFSYLTSQDLYCKERKQFEL